MVQTASRIRLIMELRSEGITDSRVLSAIEKVRREDFIPEAFQHQAYENRALPIGLGQTISQPSVIAFMTQKLEIGHRMKILEIGTGSGYQAAVLAKLCRRVYSIERHPELLQQAEQRFREHRINNITTRSGDGMKGWPEQTPFDRIIVTAAASRQVPQALLDQLSRSGILVAPVGDSVLEQWLYKYTFDSQGEVVQERLWPVRFVPLVPS